MDWEKMRVPKEEINKFRFQEPKAMTPVRQRALLRHLLGIPGANFVGKRNHTKLKVFILLFNTRDGFLSAEEIAAESGVSFNYCRNRLPLWFEWGYIRRKTIRERQGLRKRYAISRKGCRYLERVPSHIAAQIKRELQNYRNMAVHVKQILKD
jgi:hypothetical protein